MVRVNKRVNEVVISPDENLCLMNIKGKIIRFDLDDFDKVNRFIWNISNKGYVITTKNTTLHNVIMNVTSHDYNIEVDHINRNRLDNRKCNLRFVNRQINNLNTGNQKNNKSSGLKGVSWHSQRKMWRAYIMLDWKQIHLGLYNTIEEAYKVRLEYENKLLNDLLDKYNKDSEAK